MRSSCPRCHGLTFLRPVRFLAPVAVLLLAGSLAAEDGAIGTLLQAKGVGVVEAKGAVTDVDLKDGSRLSDADFAQIARLAHLKSLSLNRCADGRRLALLAPLAELERLSTNGAQLTDDGLRPLAELKNLRALAFFHPGKEFSGTGLAHLANLPKLESLTVAGSLAFGDEGLAAVARLTRLKNFRTWHAGGTDRGVELLKSLTNLSSLALGQRLSYAPPACPSDATLHFLAGMRSLESLQFDEARLSLAALAQLQRLPALKKLTLAGIDISPADIEPLRRALPRAKGDWTAPSTGYQKRIQSLFNTR